MIDPADLRDVFDRAASLPPQDRAAFLARTCGENLALRQEVERLLAADARAGSVFDSGSSGGDSDVDRNPPARDDTAALRAGARLGPYVIVGAAGRGGMGEVYRARDTRLDRIVALKVLPSALVGDAAARRRFEREARAAAALSHPHICTLLDIGRQDETDFIVMEFVDGDTLAHRLAGETPPLRESLRIGIEIGEALAAAHAAHIVHRDIKPGNVMLRPDGFVKVLDFGLAKLAAPIPTDGGDTTQALSTRAGLIIGTVAYMSPEQARGQDVDARTDLWSLGCVLYELVAGRPPFAGTSTTDVLAAVLQSDPVPLPVIKPNVPAELQRIVATALRKDRNERYQTANELLLDLKALRDAPPYSPSGNLRQESHSQQPTVLRPRARHRLASALAVVLVAAIAGMAWRSRSASPIKQSSDPVQRNLTRLTFDDGLQIDPAFSPDGRFIAYASDKTGNFDIWVQPVAGGDAVQVTKAAVDETQPTWSADGNTIAFRSEQGGGGIFLVPALGGLEHQITRFGTRPRWSPDGSFLLFAGNPILPGRTATADLYVVKPGGAPQPVLNDFLLHKVDIAQWAWHPGGKSVSLYGQGIEAGGDSSGVLLTVPLVGGAAAVAHDHSQLPIERFEWAPDGRSIFVQRVVNGISTISRVGIDDVNHELVERDRLTAGGTDAVGPALSPDGSRLVFTSRSGTLRPWLYRWVSDKRLQLSATAEPMTKESGYNDSFAVSADGRRLAFSNRQLGVTDSSLSIDDVVRAQRVSRLKDDNTRDIPKWSRDGAALAYRQVTSTQTGWEGRIVVWRADALESTIVSVKSPDMVVPCDWSPDGAAVLGLFNKGGRFSLLSWSTEGAKVTPGATTILDDGVHDPFDANYSPDGRWVAVSARMRSARTQLELGIVPATGGAWVTLLANFGWIHSPRWSSDGRVLWFASNKSGWFNIWSLPIDRSGTRATGPPRQLTFFDSSRHSLPDDAFSTGFSEVPGGLVLPIQELSGNIWMLDNVDK